MFYYHECSHNTSLLLLLSSAVSILVSFFFFLPIFQLFDFTLALSLFYYSILISEAANTKTRKQKKNSRENSPWSIHLTQGAGDGVWGIS
jgi:hypothetical protein